MAEEFEVDLSGRYPTDDPLALTPNATSWLVADTLPAESVIIVAGKGGSGKTLFINDLVVSVLTGKPFLDTHEVFGSGKVVFIDADQGKEMTVQRLHGIFHANGFEPTRYLGNLVRIVNAIELNSHEGEAELRYHVEKHRPKVLVIDCLRRVVGGEYKEAEPKSNSEVFRVLRKLAEEFKLGVMLIHHSVKHYKGRMQPDHISGSGDIYNSSDGAFCFDHDNGERLDGFKVSHVGRFIKRYGVDSTPFMLGFRFNNRELGPGKVVIESLVVKNLGLDDTTPADEKEAVEEVVAWVRTENASGFWGTVANAAEQFRDDYGKHKLRDAFRQAHKDGRLLKATRLDPRGAGLYAVPEFFPQALEGLSIPEPKKKSQVYYGG